MVQEFTLTNTGGSSGSKTANGHTTQQANQRTQQLLQKHHGLGQSDEVLHQIAEGPAKKAKPKKTVAKKAAAKAKAEKAIPMKDEANTSSDDLKEFNS